MTIFERFSDRPFIVSCIVALAAILVYYNAPGLGFVNFDDHVLVYENPWISSGLSFENITTAFTEPLVGNWTPLAWVSHMLDMDIWGMWAGGHHLTSVLLHAMASAMLYFAWQQKRPRDESFFLALLFAVHPIHVESVAWVSERRDVLAALFFMLILGVWLNDRIRESAWGRVGVLILLICGLWSKSSMVTMPCVLLLLDVMLLKRDRSTLFIALEKAPHFAAVVIFSAITAIAQQASAINEANLGFRVVGSLVAYGHYLKTFVLPIHLAVVYQRPAEWPVEDIASATIALAIFFGLAIFHFYRTGSRIAALGVLWFLGTLVPMIGILQVGQQAYADRYMYLPSIGVSIVLWEFASIHRRARLVVFSAWIALLAAATPAQVRTWQDAATMWMHARAAGHESAMTYRTAGTIATLSGDLDLALVEFRNSLLLNRTGPAVPIGIGYVQYRQGTLDEAESSFKEAIRREADKPIPFYWLGRIYEDRGEWRKAHFAYRAAFDFGLQDLSGALGFGRAAYRLADAKGLARVRGRLDEIRKESPTAGAFAQVEHFWDSGQQGKAVQELDLLLSSMPTLVDALVFRIAIALGAGGAAVDVVKVQELLVQLKRVEGDGARVQLFERTLAHVNNEAEPDERPLAATFQDKRWRDLLSKREMAVSDVLVEVVRAIKEDAVAAADNKWAEASSSAAVDG